ncbi:MAG: protease modulator HflC [Thermodesulfobacteriota bacterium]|nr:protease modulator HflC [Thermodesulfobacteriota bacterium]
MAVKKTIPLLVVIILVFIALSQSVFTVDQTEMAIVLQLGKPISGVKGPGLHFKTPFVQNVMFFDSRVLEYDANPAEILTKDKKNMLVDNYTKWRIKDPLQFFRTVRTINGAQARLDDIIYAELRVALGQYTLIEVVNQKRAEIMAQVTEKSSELIREYGIEVIDVRIKRTDLPPENERAIFGRMRAERERTAKQYRSEGREESVKIKSGADRERILILADAERKSAILHGQGDAEATRIYAEALKQSPEFYAFKRSLEAYEKSLKENTRLIITPESEFFRYMR